MIHASYGLTRICAASYVYIYCGKNYHSELRHVQVDDTNFHTRLELVTCEACLDTCLYIIKSFTIDRPINETKTT